MDTTLDALIGTARDAYASGVQARVAAKAAAGETAAMDPAAEKRMRKTAQDFEAFFIGQMMEHMMTGIEPDSMFGGGHGEAMWRSMLNQEYGKELAKTNRLGIADHVMRGMLQAQEQRDTARADADSAPMALR